MKRLPLLLLTVSFLVWITPVPGQAPNKQQDKPRAPTPEHANVSYGPHARNVFDLWLPKSSTPTALVLFIHGGGFHAGDKTNLSPSFLAACLKEGFAVAAINYRLSPEVKFPAHFHDCARALQFLRSKAGAWNLDPTRVGSTGGSAGACTSLWLAFHDDLADAKSADPVARQSTRLTCAAVNGAQTTLDTRVMKKLIGGRVAEHKALPGFLGLPVDQAETEKAYQLLVEASPATYLTADDPPVYLFYSEPKGPLPAEAKPGQGIHHPNFGTYLKEKMDVLKIECIVRHQDDGANHVKESVAFLVKHLKSSR